MSVHTALQKRYPAPAWGLLFEVPNATGLASNRRADAIAMSLWPSRGLELHCIEIKEQRGDWLRELRDPRKAESIAAYCERFYLATAAGVAQAEEIPPGWGWLELQKGGTLKQRKEAPAREPKACDRPFLASLFRSLAEGMAHFVRRDSIADQIHEAVEAACKREREVNDLKAKRAEGALEELKEAVARFERETGVSLNRYQLDVSIRDIKLARALKSGRTSLDQIRSTVRTLVEVTERELALLDEAEPALAEAAATGRRRW